MKTIKTFYAKYGHGIPLLVYFSIYLYWFCHLEKTVTKHYQVIYMAADAYIPFCELFIVPYLLWFAYVAAVVIYLFFNNKEDYYKCCIFLATGMTVFLLISTLWPNGHHLRPVTMPRDNIFSRLVSFLYETDTATNLWPSIHVYNSLGAHFAVMHSKNLAKKKGLHIASLLLAASIIMSTVFLKQHSVFDVLTAFGLAAIMYAVIYYRDFWIIIQAYQKKKKAKPLAE